jgi:hypothetical protein
MEPTKDALLTELEDQLVAKEKIVRKHDDLLAFIRCWLDEAGTQASTEELEDLKAYAVMHGMEPDPYQLQIELIVTQQVRYYVTFDNVPSDVSPADVCSMIRDNDSRHRMYSLNGVTGVVNDATLVKLPDSEVHVVEHDVEVDSFDMEVI